MLSQLRFLGPWDVVVAVIDITIVAYVLYKGFMLIRGTRAVQLIKGIIVLVIATSISRRLNLVTIHWLLQNIQAMLIVAIPIVFQPELRRALEQLGRGRFFAKRWMLITEEDRTRVIDEIVKGVEVLSRNKIGALMVLERETGLNEIIETGIKIDGLLSAEFLVNIFIPNTPLHDGAVIIRGNRVMAAATFLPLTEAPDVRTELGSRHRAALGISEHSDALAVVVSEETGNVSLANGGKLIGHLDEKTLKEMLLTLMEADRKPVTGLLNRGSL